MKKIVLLLLLVSLPNISISQGWISISISPYTDTYFDFHFPNSQTGYGLSVGFQVIKTTNGGQNWNVIANEGFDVSAIHFVNAETGFVCGDYGRIFKTVNGGFNWAEWISPYSNFYIYDITFTDMNTGYSCARDFIYKTTNRGYSWDTIRNGISGWLYKIWFVNDSTGFVTGDNGLYKTTDNGNSWINIAPIRSEFGIMFADESTGYATGGYSGKIFKTIDGGYNWSTIYENDTLDVYSIYAIGLDTLYAGTDKGIIIKTTDGGINWSHQDLLVNETNKNIYSLYFINSTAGFCAGGYNDAFFYSTTTGGKVGISNISTEIPKSFILHQNYPNPFNPETKIKFEIPQTLNPAQNNNNVRLIISNSLGQEVNVLINETLQPGVYEYSFNSSSLPSGVYFYSLFSKGIMETKKMTLLK